MTLAFRTRPTRADGIGVDPWGRRRLVLVVTGLGVATVLLIVGLGYAVYLAASSTSARSDAWTSHQGVQRTGIGTAAIGGSAQRKAIAAAPMLPVTPDDMRPTDPAPVTAPPIRIPMAIRIGPSSVPTGFPHTPRGAVGQLAAIETTVLQAMSIPLTDEVYQAWVMPGFSGGVGVGSWELTQDVQSFLGSIRSGQVKDPTTSVVAEPAGALVKGTDGRNWTLACVLLTVRATITVDAQMGYGYCAAMQWSPSGTGGRWMIAPGKPAAKAPSTWPGSAMALKAGWHTWHWDSPLGLVTGSTGRAGR